MLQLVTKRLAGMVLIILGLTAVLFVLQRVSPLDPVHAMLGQSASAEAVAAQRHALGLDQSLPRQYEHYLVGLLHGDFGDSYRTRRPVGTDLATAAPATLELMLCALFFAIVLAVLLAVATTLNWPGNRVLRMVLFVAASAPPFLLAIAGILVFFSNLGWLPATGRSGILDAPTGPTGLLTVDGLLHGRFDVFTDALKHLLLPALAIAVGPAVSIGRVLRSSLVSTTGSAYVRTARSKGLGERQVLLRHVIRNALGPALSMTGLQAGLMFAGVLVIEQVFSWPGMGQYMAQSIPVGDFPAIAGVTLLLGAGYVLINMVVDILQAAADPRIDV